MWSPREPQIPATFFPRLCARPSSERLDLTSAHLETKKLKPKEKSPVAWPRLTEGGRRRGRTRTQLCR